MRPLSSLRANQSRDYLARELKSPLTLRAEQLVKLISYGYSEASFARRGTPLWRELELLTLSLFPFKPTEYSDARRLSELVKDFLPRLMNASQKMQTQKKERQEFIYELSLSLSELEEQLRLITPGKLLAHRLNLTLQSAIVMDSANFHSSQSDSAPLDACFRELDRLLELAFEAREETIPLQRYFEEARLVRASENYNQVRSISFWVAYRNREFEDQSLDKIENELETYLLLHGG